MWIPSNVAGATDIPLQKQMDVSMVIFEPPWYRGSENGQKKNFHIQTKNILQFFIFLEKSKGPLYVKNIFASKFDETQN